MSGTRDIEAKKEEVKQLQQQFDACLKRASMFADKKSRCEGIEVRLEIGELQLQRMERWK